MQFIRAAISGAKAHEMAKSSPIAKKREELEQAKAKSISDANLFRAMSNTAGSWGLGAVLTAAMPQKLKILGAVHTALSFNWLNARRPAVAADPPFSASEAGVDSVARNFALVGGLSAHQFLLQLQQDRKSPFTALQSAGVRNLGQQFAAVTGAAVASALWDGRLGLAPPDAKGISGDSALLGLAVFAPMIAISVPHLRARANVAMAEITMKSLPQSAALRAAVQTLVGEKTFQQLNGDVAAEQALAMNRLGERIVSHLVNVGVPATNIAASAAHRAGAAIPRRHSIGVPSFAEHAAARLELGDDPFAGARVDGAGESLDPVAFDQFLEAFGQLEPQKAAPYAHEPPPKDGLRFPPA